MMNEDATLHRRRDVLCGGIRYGLLGLGGLALSALAGRGRIGPAGETCPRDGRCAGCRRSPTCNLPAALSRRRARNAKETP